MNATPTRYVSHLLNGEKPNEFFIAIEPYIFDSLVREPREVPSELDELYVSARLKSDSFTESEKETLLRRLPRDVLTAIRTKTPPADHLGVLEADFIDFFTNFEEHKVLLLRGPIGIGKTTFLKYMYCRVFPAYKSLQDFLPITLDMFLTGTDKPSYKDIVSTLFLALEKRADLESHFRSDKNRVLKDFKGNLKKLRRRHNSDDASTIIEAVGAIKSLLPSRKLVVTFDNLDHLDFDHAHTICVLGRGINRACQIPVVISLRRSTHAAVMSSPKDRGAFYQYRMDLMAPDLRSVIEKRLGVAFKKIQSITITTDGGAKWNFDPRSGFWSVVNLMLVERLQDSFMIGVCGNNVRVALRNFVYFLRYRDLDYTLLFGDVQKLLGIKDSPGHVRLRSVTPSLLYEHFVDGLILGARECYKEQQAGPICNVWVFDPKNAPPNYVLTYRVLSHLDFHGDLLLVNELRRDLGYFPPHRADLDALMRRLLEWRLVHVSDSEFSINKKSLVGISIIGKYYINELFRYPEYLYKLIFDIPLPHAAWRKGERDSYKVRVQSLHEYLRTLIDVEAKEIEVIASRGEYRQAARVIADKKLLSRHAFNAVLKINSGAARSRTHPATAELALKWIDRFKEMEVELGELEKRINAYCETTFMVYPTPLRKEQLIQVSDERKEFVVHAPKIVEPGRPNRCYLMANLSAYSDILLSHSQIVGLWSCQHDEMQFRKLIPFSRSNGEHEYVAEVSFDDVENSARFPTTQLTVFCGPEILRVANLS